MKQRVYFLRWGITTDISLISRRTGSLPLAGAEFAFTAASLFVPFLAGLEGTPSSSRRFLDAGSAVELDMRLFICRDI